MAESKIIQDSNAWSVFFWSLVICLALGMIVYSIG